jgi:hypothetical protein
VGDVERKVAVGWVVEAPEGRLAAVEAACDALHERMCALLPDFEWEMPVVHRPPQEEEPDGPTEPADLIREGEAERDARRWDLCLIVVDRPLAGRTREAPLAAVSRAFSAAVLALDRLRADGGDEADRLQALALNLIGRLTNLPLVEDDPADMMALAPRPADLDRQAPPSAAQLSELREALGRIADARVEERPERPKSRLGFWFAAVRENRTEILQALRRARPWAFPLRLGKLTAAAVSTLLILTLTAEAWDVALRQPPVHLALLTLAALVGASGFLLWRQRLLDRPDAAMDSELRVAANTMIVGITLLGMLSTYALVVAASLALHLLLFGDALVASWSARQAADIAFGDYLKMAALVGLLGLAIGALGASFESRGYLRHVAFIDEEI